MASETTAIGFQVSTAAARLHLLRLALPMLATYIVYIIAFPLIPYILLKTRPTDLELIMRRFPWFAPIYIGGLFVLFWFFRKAVRFAHDLSVSSPDVARSLRSWALGSGAVLFLSLIWLYPISAIDVFGYVVRGRLWSVYGSSPMTTTPDAFPDDPYTQFAGEYSDRPSPYGPFWEIAAQIPLRMGADDLVQGVIGMKLVLLVIYLFTAALIGWMAFDETSQAQGHSSPLTALIFFAWNPLILMQVAGNGHNDILLLALMVLSLLLWWRRWWWGAIFAATLGALVKLPGLLILPLLAVAILSEEPLWGRRVWKAFVISLIFATTVALVYSLTGPFPQVMLGLLKEFTARGYAPASAIRMFAREILPRRFGSDLPSQMAGGLFFFYYGYLMLRVWSGQTTLTGALFRAYFGFIFLAPAFHIWYPLWLIPFAALHLTSVNAWRTWLFGLTAELSIVSYYVGWRWGLRWLPIGGEGGLLEPYWNYWAVMTVLTVPWAFGLPLLIPILKKHRSSDQFNHQLAL